MTELEKKESTISSNVSNNIFEDFATDANFSKEIGELEEIRKHDSIYYLGFVGSFLKWLNSILVFFIFLSFLYITLQNKEEAMEWDILNPICSLFLWDTSSLDGHCSWIEYTKPSYQRNLEDVKIVQYNKISSIIGKIYSLENFIYSKEVSFLLDRTKNRVKPLEIISKFDLLKNKFDIFEKARIQCNNFIIDKNNFLKMTCVAYSSDWDKEIIWFEGVKDWKDIIEWTSISLANSFINYIDKNSKDFTLVNKQKIFSNEPFFWNGTYTRKTIFDLSLKYNDNNL